MLICSQIRFTGDIKIEAALEIVDCDNVSKANALFFPSAKRYIQ